MISLVDACFAAQSRSEVKQNQSKRENTFDTQCKSTLYLDEKKTYSTLLRAYSAHLGLICFNFISILAVHSNCLFVCLFVKGDSSSQIIAHWTLDGTDSDVK